MNTRKKIAYVPSPRSMPVAEDIEACNKKFINVYDMVLVATERARELARGDVSVIKGHKPTVTALLEIEAGKLEDPKKIK